MQRKWRNKPETWLENTLCLEKPIHTVAKNRFSTNTWYLVLYILGGLTSYFLLPMCITVLMVNLTKEHELLRFIRVPKCFPKMASNNSLVGVIKTPVIVKLTQLALIHLEIDYVRYVWKLKKWTLINQKKVIYQSLISVTASMGNCYVPCVSWDRLKMQFIQRFYDWCGSGVVWRSSQCYSSLDCFQTQRTVSSVKLTVCDTDPAGAALMFCADFVISLDKHNASDIVKDTDNSKVIIGTLEYKIEPALLWRRITDKRASWSKEEKCSIFAFLNQSFEPCYKSTAEFRRSNISELSLQASFS